MSKTSRQKKKLIKGTYALFIGAIVVDVVNNEYDDEITFKLADGRIKTMGIFTEGSYSDWWEVIISHRKNTSITHYKVFEDTTDNGNIVNIYFYSNDVTVLHIKGVFHNDSWWDYGCYMEISCADLNILERYDG